MCSTNRPKNLDCIFLSKPYKTNNCKNFDSASAAMAPRHFINPVLYCIVTVLCYNRGSECVGSPRAGPSDPSFRWFTGRIFHAASSTTHHAVDSACTVLWSDSWQWESYIGKCCLCVITVIVILIITVIMKVKYVDLYSVPSRTFLTRSNMDRALLPANNTISAFTHKHSSGGATTHIRIANAWVQLTTHLSTPWGWMTELAMLVDIQRTVYPEEVTHQLHVMAGKVHRS